MEHICHWQCTGLVAADLYSCLLTDIWLRLCRIHDYFSIRELVAHAEEANSLWPQPSVHFSHNHDFKCIIPTEKAVLSVASPKEVWLLLCKVIEMFKSLWRHGRQLKNKIQLVDSEADTALLWSWSIEWKLMMCSHKRGEYYFLVFSIKQKTTYFMLVIEQ